MRNSWVESCEELVGRIIGGTYEQSHMRNLRVGLYEELINKEFVDYFMDTVGE